MNNEIFDFFMDELLTDAVKEFKATEEGGLLKQRLNQMEKKRLMYIAKRSGTAFIF